MSYNLLVQLNNQGVDALGHGRFAEAIEYFETTFHSFSQWVMLQSPATESETAQPSAAETQTSSPPLVTVQEERDIDDFMDKSSDIALEALSTSPTDGIIYRHAILLPSTTLQPANHREVNDRINLMSGSILFNTALTYHRHGLSIPNSDSGSKKTLFTNAARMYEQAKALMLTQFGQGMWSFYALVVMHNLGSCYHDLGERKVSHAYFNSVMDLIKFVVSYDNSPDVTNTCHLFMLNAIQGMLPTSAAMA